MSGEDLKFGRPMKAAQLLFCKLVDLRKGCSVGTWSGMNPYVYGSAFSSVTNCVRFNRNSAARGCDASTRGITGCNGCSFHQAVLHASVQKRFCLGPACCLRITNGLEQRRQRGEDIC